MQCTNAFYLDDQKIVVPCGRCRACRIRRASEWTVRLYHESLYHDDSLFVTLTYDDVHLPENGDLCKRDFQAFMKSLRSDYEHRLKYYACGEYGDKTGRPHYHAIIYGVSLAEHGYKRFASGKRYPSTIVADKGPVWSSWRKGNVILGTVTVDSIQYVAKYIHKKLYGEAAERDERVQPFSLMSKRLGMEYVKDHERELRDRGYVMMNGKKVGMPRYYAKVLGIEDEMVASVGEGRAARAKDYAEYWRRSKQFDKNLEAMESMKKESEL